MTFPIPPGENTPLVEGLGVEWNDVVSAFPEDKRIELGTKLRDRVNGYETQLKEFEPWEQFQKSGLTPEHVDSAVNLFSLIENDPKRVYEAIGEHLNITPAQAKAAVKEMKETTSSDDPRIQTLEDQIATLAQIQLTERQMSVQEQAISEAEQELDDDLNALQEKYGEFPEEEIVMRMSQLECTAEEAYQHYSQLAGSIRQRPPSPMVMGQGGSIPSRAVDVTKLNGKDTRNLVAQMMAHGNTERQG